MRLKWLFVRQWNISKRVLMNNSPHYQLIELPKELRRLRQMEARLDMVLEAHSKANPQDELSKKIQRVLMDTLQFVKDGKDNE